MCVCAFNLRDEARRLEHGLISQGNAAKWIEASSLTSSESVELHCATRVTLWVDIYLLDTCL